MRFPEEPDDSESSDNPQDYEVDLDPDAGKSQQEIVDEMTGQLRLFTDEDEG